ncbi:MAG: PucR family transcriptional regulator [Acidimicrobiales bacterium]
MLVDPVDVDSSAGGPEALTVADILQLGEVQAGQPRVVAGKNQLHRAVRWVHVAEVPDIAQLLRGGELILTTGIALPDDGGALTDYIRDLAQAGVSGIGIELVRRYTEMPREVVDAAEEWGVPLIALERETPFVAITEAVHAQILNRQLAELRTQERVHRAFHSLASGASPGDVVRKMSELASCPVVFENLIHRPIAVAEHSVPIEELLAGWQARSRQRSDDHPGWFASPVEPRGQPCGRVVMLTDERHGALPRAVLEGGAAMLAVAWLTAGPPAVLERAAVRELIDDISAGRCRTIDEVIVRARALGVVLRHQQLTAFAVRSSHPYCSEETVCRAVERAGCAGLVGQVREDQVLALLALPANRTPSQLLADVALEVRNGFVGAPEALSFGAASIPLGPALADLGRALTQADEAAQATLGSGDARVATVDDIELRGVLRLLSDDRRLQRFVSGQLRRLWEHDERHGTRLLDILTVYLESGGNKSTAAARSHLSRAAFYHSLDRLTVVLGRDLEVPEVRTALHLALLATAIASDVGHPPWSKSGRPDTDDR